MDADQVNLAAAAHRTRIKKLEHGICREHHYEIP